MDFRLSFFGWTFSLIQKIKFVIENKQMSSEFFLYTLSVEEGAMQHLPICLYIFFYQSRESIAELINKYDCCIFYSIQISNYYSQPHIGIKYLKQWKGLPGPFPGYIANGNYPSFYCISHIYSMLQLQEFYLQ